MTKLKRRTGMLTAVLVAWATCVASFLSPEGLMLHATPQVSLGEVATAIQAGLSDPAAGILTAAEQTTLRTLYRPGEYLPLWLDAQGRPISDAREALAVLARAREDGLDPADYGADQLRSLAGRLEMTPLLARDLAGFDLALSRGMLRYLRHLRLGRIDPGTIGFRLDVSTESVDFVAILRAALVEHRIVERAAELRPRLAQYHALRTMLARYRLLAEDTTLTPLPPSGVVRPGDPYVGIPTLYRWLVALSDLPEGTVDWAILRTLDGPLVEGIKRFQARHGLEPDGVLGVHTQAALRVPIAWRVRQIELALERLRWWPDRRGQRLIEINIPMFRLWAWDVSPLNDTPAMGTAVIVGRAIRTQTPVFAKDMLELIFRPYWNVPSSILRNEILPDLRRNPDYLLERDMEIVRGPGDDAQPVEPSAENLILLQQGQLRLRQRVGPGNALGLVKFLFPNEENVYLHATPAQALFKRSRRDFSHGCVRVEDAIGLAEWTLKDQPEWTRERILAAMHGTPSRHVKLVRPIRVILSYTTAAILPEDRAIHFAEDIYNHDGRLDRALARQSAQTAW